MTVEPSWRIVDSDVFWPPVQALLDNGTLVPDTSKQAIADAWNKWRNSEQWEPKSEGERWGEFMTLLDALTEEDSDD